jgi:hypothetical protein
LGGTLLGTGGAALGAAAGSALDEKAAQNLRHDQLHLYEAAALHPRLRAKTLAESAVLLGRYFGDDYLTEAFQRGYERGQAYHQNLLERFPSRKRRLKQRRQTMDRIN